MSSVPEYFDVLSIDEKNEKVDIIQSLIGTDCLGTYFENGTAQLYFDGGKRDYIEVSLKILMQIFIFSGSGKNKIKKIGIWHGRITFNRWLSMKSWL